MLGFQKVKTMKHLTDFPQVAIILSLAPGNRIRRGCFQVRVGLQFLPQAYCLQSRQPAVTTGVPCFRFVMDTQTGGSGRIWFPIRTMSLPYLPIEEEMHLSDLNQLKHYL